MSNINDVLLQLGVTPNLKGFEFIRRAVDIINNNDSKISCIGIYKTIAEEVDTKASNVERAIRHAISKMDIPAYIAYTGASGLKNSEVIYTLALKLKED